MDKIVNTPWTNVNSESDINDMIIWNRLLLQVLGIWPLVYPQTPKLEKLLALILFTLSWFGLGFLLVPMTVYTFSNASAMAQKIKMIGPLGHVVTSSLNYFFLTIRCKRIQRCIKVQSSDWRIVDQEEHREIMTKNSDKSNVLCKFCIVFMYAGGICYYSVMPFLSKRPEGEKNFSMGPMPYPGFEIIFDMTNMQTYVFVFVSQCISATVMFNVTTSVCCLAVMFVAHACGQIQIVMSRLDHYVKNVQENYLNPEKHMSIIVKHHVEALK